MPHWLNDALSLSNRIRVHRSFGSCPGSRQSRCGKLRGKRRLVQKPPNTAEHNPIIISYYQFNVTFLTLFLLRRCKITPEAILHSLGIENEQWCEGDLEFQPDPTGISLDASDGHQFHGRRMFLIHCLLGFPLRNVCGQQPVSHNQITSRRFSSCKQKLTHHSPLSAEI